MCSTTVIARYFCVSHVHGWFWHKMVISYYQKMQMRKWCLPDGSFLLCSCKDATDSIQHQLAVILLFWSYFDVYSSHPRLQPVYLIPFVFTDMTYHAVWFIYIYIYTSVPSLSLPLSFSLSLSNLNPFLKLHLNIYFALFIQLARE